MHIENNVTDRNREALDSLVRKGDRREPFLFVGRDAIFEDVEKQLWELREAGRSLDNAHVIEGPPGSGKTSVLRELRNTYIHSEDVLPVHLTGNHLNHPPQFVGTFAESCGFGNNFVHGTTQKAYQGTLGIKGITLGVGYGSSKLTPVERLQTGEPVWSVLNNCLEVPSDKLFIVLIDEAQRVRATYEDLNDIAISLGDGETGQLKVFTVFSGLSDTRQKLSDVGVSPRITGSKPSRLGTLQESEVQLVLDEFWSHSQFGFHDIPANTLAAFNQAIIETSECYPRHLQAYMRGIAGEFVSGTPRITLERVLEIGHEFRVDHYEDVLDRVDFGEYGEALTECLRQRGTGETFTAYEVKDIAKTKFGMTNERIDTVFHQCIHCGVFEVDDQYEKVKRHLQVPIPSLRTHLSTGRDRKKTIELLRDRCRHLLSARCYG